MRGKKQKKPVSRTTKAGLKLSVGRVHTQLRKGKYAERISADAPIFLAAVLVHTSKSK